MNIVQLTPGTGGMYCGNCLRDNALIAELRAMGHDALMLPLYLPLKLDDANQSEGAPIFFGGINVYLEQKLPLFRVAPAWLRTLLASPRLLAKAAGHSAKTRAEDVGDILISMLQGEDGRQVRELEDLVAWLKTRPRPDAVCLSNALLLGMAGALRQQLGTRLVCFLQGEDSYVDALADGYRDAAWTLLREKAAHADLFIAPNRYFASVMKERLGLAAEKVRIVPDGLRLDGFKGAPNGDGMRVRGQRPASTGSRPPTLGYFARMCPEKGLGVLVDAFIDLRQRSHHSKVQLKVGGGCGPADEAYVKQLKDHLDDAGLRDGISWHPNLSREEKIGFLRSLDVFSVPATYPEAFGMYLAEALAAGVPVVQPRFASFTDFVETTGGGVLYDPNAPKGLADALDNLLSNPVKAAALGEAGQRAVHETYSASRVARDFCEVIASMPAVR